MLITCRDIASVGRFGNQLFTYCLARGYAERMGCEFQCGDWVGRKIFENVNDAMVSVQLPQTECDSKSDKPLLYFAGQRNIDIKVFAQHQCYLEFYTRAKAKEWLKLKPAFERYAPTSKTHSAAHLRRGDYVSDPWLKQHYCEVSNASYDRAIEQFNIPKPVLKVQEGWKAPNPELEAQGIGWLSDFLILRDAAHLLRANSSFSVWASWLGNGITYSPKVDALVGLQNVSFVEGNHECTAGIFKNQSSLYLKDK